MKPPNGDVKAVFGRTIRKQRSGLGMSQEELADRAGLHRTYISDVERGTRNLSLENIAKLAEALQLSMASLFDRSLDGSRNETPVEILLVEDDVKDAEYARKAFTKATMANPLHVVGDGRAALDFVFARGRFAESRRDRIPGLILLKLDLPKMPGLDVIRRLRTSESTQSIPIVIVGNARDQRRMAQCRIFGVENFLTKPLDLRQLCAITLPLRFEWALVKARPE